MTDGQGRLVSFKNCLIIMTSNLGSQEIYRHTVVQQQQQQQGEAQLTPVRVHGMQRSPSCGAARSIRAMQRTRPCGALCAPLLMSVLHASSRDGCAG